MLGSGVWAMLHCNGHSTGFVMLIAGSDVMILLLAVDCGSHLCYLHSTACYAECWHSLVYGITTVSVWPHVVCIS